MLCTILFFLFSFRKNQQMELQGSPHAEPHSMCTGQDGRHEIQRGVSKQKGCAKIQCWKMMRQKPSSIHQKCYWAQHHETSAFDSNAKAGNAIILHKIWRHLFDPDHSSWHWHGIWQLFMLVSWLSWWRKTCFFPSCMQYRWDSAKAAPAANNSTLTAGVTVNMWRTCLGCIYLSSAAQLGLPLRWETA